ncbi:MAG: aminotransferase class I/II-fold pyridoxal phosphate-dependent enzyme [Magnetococcales bacterium]|nr:aminotransferase class I/II-fold pyridoxal phosphate-dependent enzyme [Magnetococcales bacterium]
MSRPHSYSSSLLATVTDRRDRLRAAGWLTDEWEVENLPAPTVRMGGREYVSFASNNYLGLSRHPAVRRAARRALEEFGHATTESRRLGGGLTLLRQLEEALAAFEGSEACLTFATGLLTNVAVIPALMDAGRVCERFFALPAQPGEGDGEGVILSDALNHRSIQMGVRLAHAPCQRYRHGDAADLAQRLHGLRGRRILIVTDTVFSMEGDLAPLPEIVALAEEHGAALMVDEAHATGVFGPGGRGAGEHFGLEGRIPLRMGTLSKALGAMGGFLAASEAVVDYLRFTASGYRFTSPLPAEQAAASLAALEILQQEPQWRARLWGNVARLLKGLLDLGFPIPRRWSPILPLFLPTVETARRVENFLLERGVLCPAIVAPLAPVERPRLRLTINATHTPGQLDDLLALLEEAAHRFALPREPDHGEMWRDVRGQAPDYLIPWLTEGAGL